VCIIPYYVQNSQQSDAKTVERASQMRIETLSVLEMHTFKISRIPASRGL
jgi:hypothetical protein